MRPSGIDIDLNAPDSNGLRGLLPCMPADERLSLCKEMYLIAYEEAYSVAKAVAKKFCAKYYWEDPDDVANSLMGRFPRIFQLFNPQNSAGNPWSKYLYFRFYGEAQDYFRRCDPAGIGWPQKSQYPQWHRLGDEGFDDGKHVQSGYDQETASDGDSIRTLFDLVKELKELRTFLRACVAEAGMKKTPRKLKLGKIWDVERGRVKFQGNSWSDFVAERNRYKQLELFNE